MLWEVEEEDDDEEDDDEDVDAAFRSTSESPLFTMVEIRSLGEAVVGRGG